METQHNQSDVNSKIIIDENSIVKSENEETKYKIVESEIFANVLNDICSIEAIEFSNLYPILDSIPSDEFEKLIIVDSLKAKGFEILDWGRGNWLNGPRIVTYNLSNGQCECQVDKMYYLSKLENNFRVTERIKCKK
jgi:hypothetical protein